MIEVPDLRDWLRAEPEDDTLLHDLLTAAVAMAEDEIGGPLEVEDEGVPADIQLAIRLLVAHWYEQRQISVVGRNVTDLPFGVSRIFANHRRVVV